MRRSLFWLFLLVMVGVTPVAAQETTLPNGPRPLSLPVSMPAGPSTWMLGQPYGNTVGSFYYGDAWYRAGQGLHFGIDLSMPCGTPVTAVADAEVRAVDDLSFGSAPHNLLLRVQDAGVSILYGHLFETPNLQVGQLVHRGDVVGKSGDPDLTCNSRPHLHLEVRSLNYLATYNPINYIDAAWNSLSTVGPYNTQIFQRDLDNPRQWLTLTDQPDVHFGGRALNRYADAYPPLEGPPANPPLSRRIGPMSAAPWTLRKLAYQGCCFWPWWDATDGSKLYSIDGSTQQPANVFTWKVTDPVAFDITAPTPPPFTSPDGSVEIRMSGDSAQFHRLSDGTDWQVNTAGKVPALDPGNQQLMWLNEDGIAIPGQEPPPVQVIVASADGQNAHVLVELKGGYAVWLDSARLLTVESEHQISTLTIYNTADGTAAALGSWQRLRGLTVAPGGGRLMFYRAFDPDPNNNGVFTVEAQPGAQAVKLPWFGSWRWRDADSVFYIPFDAASDRQSLAYYDIPTSSNGVLTDANNGFTIANGDWSVSADGQRIAFLNAADLTTWLVETGS
jgi:murein DD-endopeptidase MepM/ murein hydrolase activator NlpD